MANFFLILDPDAERRDVCCRRAAGDIAVLPGLVQGSMSSGCLRVVWAAGPRAPVAAGADAFGAALLLGDAMDAAGARMSLEAVRAAFGQGGTLPPSADGYHAVVTYTPELGLRIGTDPLGMFPVFWWADGDVALAGSSPELFRRHPRFRPTLDPEGLAAMLLTGYSVGGRTLQGGVRRLAPGAVLCAEPGRPPNERRRYVIPLSSRYHGLPFSAQVDVLHEALTDSVRRHAPPNEPCAQALSGGRDSRQLAGMLHAQGSSVSALTFGERHDIEMRCARAVARRTARDHRALPQGVDAAGAYIEQHVRWTHCAGGFNAVSHWGSAQRLADVPARLVTGYAMDAIVGGTHIMWAYDTAQRRFAFDTFYARLQSYGVAEDPLGALLAPLGGRDLVAAARHAVRDVYESYSAIDAERAWCFDLHHRQRLLIGASPWLLSFGAWPVMPAVDTRVLEVAGALPVATLAERRAQDAIIIKRFPRLAELPLDRNNFDTTPLVPRARYAAAEYVRRAAARVRRRVEPAERRFYYRVHDINAPGWRAARRLAYACRDAIAGMMDLRQLDAMLPPPDREFALRNGIADASGPKMLIGVMLWARDQLG